MIIQSLTLIVAALSSAHGASHLASDLMRFSSRLASRALPTYVAPPLVLHSEALTRRWMSSTPIKAPELPKPIIHDLEKPLAVSALATTPEPKKLLEIPAELYDQTIPGEASRRLYKYITDNNLEKEFREKVFYNCTGDIAALDGGKNETFIYCAEKLREYATLDLEGLRALDKHPFVLAEDITNIRGALKRSFRELSYLTPEGKVSSSLSPKDVQAVENSLMLIDLTFKNISKM